MKKIEEYKKILAEELYEEFGFGGIGQYLYSAYVKVSEYEFIAKYGKDYNRTISWSDDDSQPDDEWLYVIRFPTGAYVFGDGDYPKDTFNTFFNELKKFVPKYIDTENHSLYFSASNAKIAHNNFYEIFNKYKNLAAVENKKRRAEKLRKELEELEVEG